MNTNLEVEYLNFEEAKSMLFRECNSYDRLPTLIDLCSSMNPHQWLSVLGKIWGTCDNITDYKEDLLDTPPFAELTNNPLVWRNHMMTANERAALAKLPPRVTIYRGCYEHNKDGLSWTINRRVAASFPFLHRYRSRGTPLLIKATIPRDQILALNNDREEDEVIALRPEIQSIRHLTRP